MCTFDRVHNILFDQSSCPKLDYIYRNTVGGGGIFCFCVISVNMILYPFLDQYYLYQILTILILAVCITRNYLFVSFYKGSLQIVLKLMARTFIKK